MPNDICPSAGSPRIHEQGVSEHSSGSGGKQTATTEHLLVSSHHCSHDTFHSTSAINVDSYACIPPLINCREFIAIV